MNAGSSQDIGTELHGFIIPISNRRLSRPPLRPTVAYIRFEGSQGRKFTCQLSLPDPFLFSRRSHPTGSPARKAYGIGESISAHSTQELLDLAVYAYGQLHPGPGNTPPKDKLKGILPTEIAALDTLRIQYQGANWAQGDAQTQAVALLALLKKEVAEVLNPLRRDLQGTADQVYTHRDPVNAAQRTAFGLQPDRPLVD